MKQIILFSFATAALIGAWWVPAHAIDPAVKCESSKLNHAGKYALCRLKAESKAVKKGGLPDFTKCDTKFADKWAKADSKGGFACPKTGGVEGEFAAALFDTTNRVAESLHSDGAPTNGNLPHCKLPTSGQTTSYGVGTDGDVEAGAKLATTFVDNGDGTITDRRTGLMWEKKDDAGGIHFQYRLYTWCGTSCGGTYEMDGTIKTTFLDTLNDVGGGGASCFAGYCDWRAPNAKELQSIIDYEFAVPAVDPVFHQAGTCTGCSDVTLASCSCTASGDYWSSTTFANVPSYAWLVDFFLGNVSSEWKPDTGYVRAVRGGL